ncbi:MAG TPA: cupin domain-containing protein [Armatimonadota bacterium]|jgi:hypothetical protein
MERTAEYWIERLNLERHPEGGYFRETYRAAETISEEALPERYAGPRSFSTLIYFLLAGDDFSAFHRLKSDEMWHFHAGVGLTVSLIHTDGRVEAIRMGPDPDDGQTFQAVIPAGCWFGAALDEPDAYALVGCTVAPGFDFADFELAEPDRLLKEFPDSEELIRRLTRA